MSGRADADLGRLRAQAGEVAERAGTIGAGLQGAGVSGALQGSWSRLRTKARRIHQLLGAQLY